MKLFKWYLVSDIDKMIYEKHEIKVLKREADELIKEKISLLIKIKKLEEELEYYKKHQKIEIIDVRNDFKRGIENGSI